MMAKSLADFVPMLQSVGLPSISGTSPLPATRLTLQAQLGKISIYKGGGRVCDPFVLQQCMKMIDRKKCTQIQFVYIFSVNLKLR